MASFDPIEMGIVDSLARPGGNITGLATLGRELGGKRLELLKEVVPSISRVGLLIDADAPIFAIALKEYETVASALKIQLQSLEVRGPNPDLEGAFQAAIKRRINALIAVTQPPPLTLPKANCRPYDKESYANNVRGKRVRGSWLPHVILNQQC